MKWTRAFLMLSFAYLSVDKSQFVKCRVATKHHFRKQRTTCGIGRNAARVASAALRLRSAVPTCFSRLLDWPAEGHAGLDDASTTAIRNTHEPCVHMSEGVATAACQPGCNPERNFVLTNRCRFGSYRLLSRQELPNISIA